MTNRADLGEKDATVTFQRILDTQDMELINTAIMLVHRAIGANARLQTAQLNKGVLLLNDAPAVALHSANMEIFSAEEEIEQIYTECDALMAVVELYHAWVAASSFRFVIYTS